MRPKHHIVNTISALTLIALGMLATLATAQRQTLDLEYGGDVYLSDVSRGLENVPAYRQHYLMVREFPDAEGEVQQEVYEWIHERTATGDRRMLERFGAPHNVTRASYLTLGQTFFYADMAGDVMCVPLDFRELEPMIEVADVTGFKSATLASAGETVNGVLTDRYTLDPPPYNPYFEALAGELWLVREGGYIVKYEIQGKRGKETTTWRYELTAAELIALPEACTAGN
jgi:hypothetical protein